MHTGVFTPRGTNKKHETEGNDLAFGDGQPRGFCPTSELASESMLRLQQAAVASGLTTREGRRGKDSSSVAQEEEVLSQQPHMRAHHLSVWLSRLPVIHRGLHRPVA